MSEATADIVGPTGAKFTLTIDGATIAKDENQSGAKLIVTGKPDIDLAVGGNGSGATVPSLPAGDSVVSLALIWPPDANTAATIDVKPGSGVTAATPKPTVDLGDTPAFIELFGK
jgi:hypothetical protein